MVPRLSFTILATFACACAATSPAPPLPSLPLDPLSPSLVVCEVRAGETRIDLEADGTASGRIAFFLVALDGTGEAAGIFGADLPLAWSAQATTARRFVEALEGRRDARFLALEALDLAPGGSWVQPLSPLEIVTTREWTGIAATTEDTAPAPVATDTHFAGAGLWARITSSGGIEAALRLEEPLRAPRVTARLARGAPEFEVNAPVTARQAIHAAQPAGRSAEALILAASWPAEPWPRIVAFLFPAAD